MIKPNEYKGYSVEENKWIYGYLQISHHDQPTQEAFVRSISDNQLKKVDPNSISRYTGVGDDEYEPIYENDIVEFYGMKGVIVQECGAYGIGCEHTIDYDKLEAAIPHSNSPYFCYNDNFISLWELIWNMGDSDDFDTCIGVKIIGNKYQNPDMV